MKKITIFIIFIGIFFVINFSFTNNANAYSINCALDRSKCSFFEKIEMKASNLNPMNYFNKRKECLRRKDNADTVAIGKRIYKLCMDGN